MSNLVVRSLCAVTGRLALCAVGLAAQLIGVSATAAEPGAVSEVPAPPPWQANRRPQRAKLLADLGADRWHTSGFRAQGVKVLVLDTGFPRWPDSLGKALPVRVARHSF